MTFYDFAAPVYGIWAALVETRAHRLAREALAAHPGRDLLEVAVGTGMEFSELAAGSGFRRLVGVELSMGMLKRAHRRRRAAPQRRTSLCQADARALPFRAKSFDSLLNCYMIDLLPETEIPIVMGEFRRVLRSDGCLVLVAMAEQRPALQRLWMTLYRRAPFLVGSCRPVDATKWLNGAVWELERKEEVSQRGFRSQMIVARPHIPLAGG